MIENLWYKNAVVYCLSVGTWLAANRNGCGDFEGLTRRSTTSTASASRRSG